MTTKQTVFSTFILSSMSDEVGLQVSAEGKSPFCTPRARRPLPASQSPQSTAQKRHRQELCSYKGPSLPLPLASLSVSWLLSTGDTAGPCPEETQSRKCDAGHQAKSNSKRQEDRGRKPLPERALDGFMAMDLPWLKYL